MFKLIVFLCLVGCLKSNKYKPVIWSKYFFQGRPVLFGLIRENETVVHLDPPLTAHDKDNEGFGQFVCAYNLHRSTKRSHPSTEFPFIIVVVDKLIGLAEVKVKTGASLSAKRKMYYKFTVTAKDCGSPALVSTKAHVLIKVVSADDSVNFVKESYLVYVEEGRIVDNILNILPSDFMWDVAFNSTCDYEILTPNLPFKITPQGSIQNTMPLNSSTATDYFFGVIAKNCLGDHSKPIFVKIIVTPKTSVKPTILSDRSSGIINELYGGHDSLQDEPSLDDLPSYQISTFNLKKLMTITVLTLCVIAVVVIILLILLRNHRTKNHLSDVYYDDNNSDLEWDNSTFDLIESLSEGRKIHRNNVQL